MFDSVGRDLDEEALQRSAKSAGLVAFLTAWGSAALFVSTLFVLEQAEILPAPDDMILTEVAEEDELAPPPPPPPPPPPAAADASTEEEDTEEPEPDDMVEEVKDLKDEVKDEMKSDAKPAGEVGGVEGGVAGGVVGGVQGGIVGGEVGSTGKPPPPPEPVVARPEVKMDDVVWTYQPTPPYPEAARGLGLSDPNCSVKISLNDKGLVDDVKIVEAASCPKVFHLSLRETLASWKAKPMKVGGVAAAFQTKFLFKYRQK
jgi:protein TonB